MYMAKESGQLSFFSLSIAPQTEEDSDSEESAPHITMREVSEKIGEWFEHRKWLKYMDSQCRKKKRNCDRCEKTFISKHISNTKCKSCRAVAAYTMINI